MKIRTITTGINLAYPIDFQKLQRFAKFSRRAKAIFEDTGYEVQTIRISTQPWPEYLGKLSKKKIITMVKLIESFCKDNGVDFLNIGTISSIPHLNLVPEIIADTSLISCSATIATMKKGINFEIIPGTAMVVLKISKTTPAGTGNFRFAAIANCPPNIPFFPASYHCGPSVFTIGLEAGDLLMKTFSHTRNLFSASRKLKRVLTHHYRRIEEIGKKIERYEKIHFKGIDLSPAPSLKKSESIALAFEKIGFGKFGTPGTLTIAALITGVLRSIKVKNCGYSGLMLPVLEDYGLARRVSDGKISIDNLLLYSAICGTGLDCLPLPGNISVKRLTGILFDVASMAIRLNKPLSARLFVVPGKKAGQITNFRFPYLIDSRIMYG